MLNETGSARSESAIMPPAELVHQQAMPLLIAAFRMRDRAIYECKYAAPAHFRHAYQATAPRPAFAPQISRSVNRVHELHWIGVYKKCW